MPDRDPRQLAEQIAARVLDRSKAQATEVAITGGREALTRFADGVIHQNLDRDVLEVSVRAIESGRTGRASTTRIDDASLGEAADRALAIARRLAPREDLLEPPPSYPGYRPATCYAESTAEATAQSRAAVVRTIVDVGAPDALSAAGSVTSDARFEAVANSRGLFAFGAYTSSVISLTMTGGGGTGYAQDGAWDMTRLDPAALARRASEKALRGADPVEVPPGDYTAILEPIAVGELLLYLLFGHACSHFSGLAVREGQSFFAGRMGEPVFGSNVTLRDDLWHPMQWGVPFDAEGTPRSALTLVDKGVVRALTYDRASALRAGTEPTGHGLAVPNTYGSVPQNIVLDGGDQPLDAIVRSTKRGILITRLWYNRLVDPAQMIVTGLTRDGTFLIEDGAIVRGVRNFRINQSVHGMLNRISAMSPVARAGDGIVAPALRVEDFRFSAVVPQPT